ncbi:replication/maintenance protein [Clostridium beijerinckii]|uniref:replication/maintenance protein n=1 Tax=Clostridium beijerinckii TaxID=1520 RepID=UPI0004791003|nr:replication/maintenance protein [Clostridium beijerinckii]
MGKIKEQHTSKKVRYIGTEQFINAETGVVEEFQVTDIEERDFNFSKVWMRNFISTLDLVGNQKTRLAFWIIDHLNKENQLIATFRSMADETGISLFTVRETMKILQDSDFLRKVSNGVYTINPDIYFKGTRNARLNILSQYHELGETKPQLTDEQKIDQIQKSIALLQRELDKLTSKKSNIINAERVFEPSEALEN